MSYRNNLRKTVNCICLFALLTGLVTGCAAADSVTQEKQPIPDVPDKKVLAESATDLPQLAEVTVGDIEKSEYYDGEINPYMQVLQFPRKGTFLEFRVSLGDVVSKGQIIAVTQPECEEEIEELEKKITSLQTEYTNEVTNFDLKSKTNAWQAGQMREIIENMDSETPGFDETCVSFELLLSEGEKLEVEKTQYIEKMEKEIAFQEAKLARMRVKNESNIIMAPEDGVIAYLADLKVGDAVSVNSYPVALADVTTPFVQCEYITEKELDELENVYAIKDGKTYELIYHPYKDGEFERKNAKGEGVYTFFEFEDEIDAAFFGEDIKVVTVKDSRENVLMVPANCIRRDGEDCFVYRYENGKREAVFVEIGISDELHTEILSGIQEGDKIYVSN